MRLAILLVATAAVAQQVPNSACDFDGFDTNAKLAEVKTGTVAYFGCGTGKCLPMTLEQGDPVVITRAEGLWTCGYLVARDGSAQGWIRSAQLRPLTPDPNPPLTAWIGEWRQGEDRIQVTQCAGYAPRVLTFDAKAYWHGPRNTVHSGQLYVRESPYGNRVRLDNQVCKIDLVLWGNYILANDDNLCGGTNVRFWGVWKHSSGNRAVACD